MYRLAKLTAAVSYLVVGVWGLLLCIRFALGAAGVVGAVAAALLFPVALAVVPWIAVLSGGGWAPLLVVYGGTLGAGLLHALARAMERGAASPPAPDDRGRDPVPGADRSGRDGTR